ncbi:MAG: M6 family metalloprotease domain-containing protein [Nocardioidaceae bacterium]|nr:M6 family metalloprotease domain-containing protein [Nocardioidaceae bacterium]
MRKKSTGLLSLVVAAGLGTTLGMPAVTASAAPQVSQAAGASEPATVQSDELPNPAEEKRRALREQALTDLLNGKGKAVQRGASTVMKVGTTHTAAAPGKAATSEDQYVELGREKTDKIFVILTDFGNQRGTDINPNYKDQDTDPNTPGPAKFDGPLNNQIPEPDRTKDNSTVWQSNYDRKHFEDLYFGAGDAAGSGGATESVRQYFERQSSGRYSIDGYVSDWVRVPYNEARYGRSNGFPCAGNVCSNTWALVRDGINTWVTDQRAAGKTDADIKAMLASYDQWDRNDYDHDGNFNEPDGYIDHFQIVHAGGDQADGDPIQGEDAIWSHRWKAFQGTGQGPEGNKDGGVQIGTTGLWVADYTIQPENGGMSVFAHEYTHDLGLPDLYDTSGPSSANENGVNFWSLMAQSRVSAPNDQGIGTRAADLGAWDKLQLGWLDYDVVNPTTAGDRVALGPHEFNSDKAQGAVVVLPKKEVKTELGAPYAGQQAWWSGQGDEMDHSMSRQVAVPAGGGTLNMQAHWNIEDCGPDACDYAYVQVDDGSGWKAIPSTTAGVTNAAEGNGIDGVQTAWTPASFDLTPYAGKTVGIRVQYLTDPAAQGTDPSLPAGIFLDDVSVKGADGSTVFTSGAEATPEGWTLDGFSAVGSSISHSYDNYLIASNRTYTSFDKYLQSGPYNFGFGSKPDFVEHFANQNGLLVSYWDTSQGDNNASQHPGEGLILPVDSHPAPINRLDGRIWRPRVAGYDAPFGLEKADSFTLHLGDAADTASAIHGQAAAPVFHDNTSYWDARQPTNSVKVPNNGVNIKVLSQQGTAMDIRVWKRS